MKILGLVLSLIVGTGLSAFASDNDPKKPGQMPEDKASSECHAVADQVIPPAPPVAPTKTGEVQSGQGK